MDHDNDNSTYQLNYKDIKQAAEAIENGVIHTPLCESKLSKFMDYNIYLKCENLQYTGSCAERGIRNLFVTTPNDVFECGVIVPSSGNMAISAAYHGGLLGVPVTVVLPERTPPAYAQHCSEFGADVVLYGNSYEDAYAYAKKVHFGSKQILINSDNPLVMAGMGTVGLEIITQLPEADAVIVPVAGGGLLAGVLIACKKLKCSTLVYGVECAKMPKMMKALQAGRPVSVPVVHNLAEGLSVSIIGNNAFNNIKGRLDRMLVVEESYVAKAIISMLESERLVADGAGVCAIAAVMQGLVPELKGKRTVCIVSGGNIESGRLARTIHRGLGAMGRLLRFSVPVHDHRSGLEELAKLISEENGVVKNLITDHTWLHGDVGATWANVVVETANNEHCLNIKERVRDVYPVAKFVFADFEDSKHRIPGR
ncbi:uncharacterized protein LOC113226297 isoform X2 [Hyposmocoma kahamanoa]|uniref:uncharacterized protein LOC113226297 isoform X1 n=1 Tax=Hyposmocoma kahamanoa TaxID=1477025 RepID=UPI000E6D63AA|nr:uncharacterized protein LOC113226297 isoform X1 [Hyposmocoma kahamanoa]XP_026314659.1 uncharacterized protein LOC113226297 isoform X2 [Hyposmocoma kahamanoa]